MPANISFIYLIKIVEIRTSVGYYYYKTTRVVSYELNRPFHIPTLISGGFGET
jgi:hypothetical protein